MKKVPLTLKKSFEYAFSIITGISTIAGIWGYTLKDINEQFQWWQCGLILLASFIVISLTILFILNGLKHKAYSTTINGIPIKIKVGDIFNEKGLKVIPFNERYQNCGSYNSHTYSCARGLSVDYRSYIKYECDKAVEAGIKIIILYNDTKVDKSKCPEIVRNIGTHKAMVYYKDGKYYWDYQSVKEAFEI